VIRGASPLTTLNPIGVPTGVVGGLVVMTGNVALVGEVVCTQPAKLNNIIETINNANIFFMF
jgi:hypothetical protein